MLCVWVHGCDQGRVSNGSRLALLCQTLSIECLSLLFFWHVLCVIVPFLLSFLSCFCFVLFSCSRWSFVEDDVPVIFSCPADHVPDWEPRRKLLGMVQARSVNVKNRMTITTAESPYRASKPQSNSERVLPWQVTMDQLIYASFFHTTIGMYKVWMGGLAKLFRRGELSLKSSTTNTYIHPCTHAYIHVPTQYFL